MNYLLIFLGGGLGCLMRFWVSYGAHLLMGNNFPYGTLIVNVTGSFLMGLILTIILKHFSYLELGLRAFLLAGFLGGYTTFSSFSIESVHLIERGEISKSLLNIGLSMTMCLTVTWLGIILGRKL